MLAHPKSTEWLNYSYANAEYWRNYTILDFYISTARAQKRPKEEQMEWVKKIIDKKGILQHQITFFFDLIQNNDTQLFDYFLKNQKNIANVMGNSCIPPFTRGTNALQIAIICNRYDMAQKLIKAGAYIHHTNDHYKSSLYYAVESNNAPMVELLLAHGAVNKKIYTYPYGEGKKLQADAPLAIAQSNNFLDIVKILIAHEVKSYIANRSVEDMYKKKICFFGYELHFGYSRQQKLEAANALLEHIKSPSSLIETQHLGALKNGDLSNIYKEFLRYESKINTPSPSENNLQAYPPNF